MFVRKCKDPYMVMEYFNISIYTLKVVGLHTLMQVLKVLFASVTGNISLSGNLIQFNYPIYGDVVFQLPTFDLCAGVPYPCDEGL